jgi:myo-inositol 2-dehydrogenase/D-chiro-inositol 1-dehydrogenase
MLKRGLSLVTAKVKVGLIDAGKIGRVHTENLVYRTSHVELVAVSDLFLEASEKCAADHQIPTVYSDHRSILADNNSKPFLPVPVSTSRPTHFPPS